MVAVGTGAALAMGEEGNADVLLVHAPSSEEELMAKGFGSQRDLIMHNDFIIVGPKDDPAAIGGMTVAADAFAKIAEAKSIFVFPVQIIPGQIKKNSLFGKQLA